MRRIMSACLCVALMLCLSACGADKNFVISPFSSNVTFTMGDVSVKGTLNFETKDNLTFTVKEPDYISGVNFSRDEVSVDDIKTSYGKVSDYSPVRAPSPQLALFIVMLPMAHLTLHSRMSGSRWVITAS